jgi:hypothetical protein
MTIMRNIKIILTSTLMTLLFSNINAQELYRNIITGQMTPVKIIPDPNLGLAEKLLQDP